MLLLLWATGGQVNIVHNFEGCARGLWSGLTRGIPWTWGDWCSSNGEADVWWSQLEAVKMHY